MAEDSKSARYSEHLDVLLALITYFSLAEWRSRSPYWLAKDLGLSMPMVMSALDAFPGLFRKSRKVHPTDVGDQPAYTLHARYARRRERTPMSPGGDESTSSTPTPPRRGSSEELDPDTLRALLDFVVEQARAERESDRHARAQIWLRVGVIVAAVSSLLTAVIQLFIAA
ncbi:hypothetical protein [Planotetraspora mira]|uniref:Uncharacterized protein n=1 Tax=Planotetraspora mira TaxID=58121 RepID=A0A8J3XE16_9ACTN|nr:hypothetical protein [Planotetraspora mira]GII33018.1 hypothetical protein Pmi06nite_64600 [Planotetraspora mira]